MQRTARAGLLLFLMTAGIGSVAQERATRIDLGRLADEQSFDFLMGSWRYHFEGGEGTARYAALESGVGVREVVEGQVGGRAFTGTSLIFRDESSGRWRQRWIDTLGAVLEGSIEWIVYGDAGQAALQATFEPLDGVVFRHVWFDITSERFETDLLVSRDGGETFLIVRRAPYVRR